MKFEKKAYYIPNNSKNNTNTKNFQDLEGNFSLYADFQLSEFVEEESLIVGRIGYHMGIFLQKPNGVKFSWYTKPYQYNDIWVPVDDINKRMKVMVTVSDTVKIYIDGILKGEKETGPIESYSDKNIFIGSINPYSGFYECWFIGDIYKIAIFNEIVNSFEDESGSLYALFDFEKNSKFKTFDKSGNGNHGIIFEDPEYSSHSINEFNKIAPSAKIV
jgi:hypothetical protein